MALEARLAARCDRPIALACNGTAAITAALMSLDQPGAVLLPSFTFPATLSAVQQAGRTPVLADVDARSWELSVDTVEAAVRRSPVPIAAVLGVRTFGLCRDWTEVQAWCDARGVPLILDSAAALGGRLADGRLVGVQGLMETFSLHATKVFAVGEGGAIACDPDRLPALRRVMNFGLDAGELVGDGFNGKVSEFTAAIGLAQDVVFDAQLAARRAAAARYAGFWQSRAPAWSIPWAPGDPPWQAYPVVAPSADAADRFEARAAARGLQIRRYYRPALHTAPSQARHAYGLALPVSGDLSARMVCLPMYSDLFESEHGDLLSRVQDALQAARS